MRCHTTALLLLVLLNAPAVERFIAPTGSSTNSGTRESPWDIASALDGTQKVEPGDRCGCWRAPTNAGRMSSSV